MSPLPNASILNQHSPSPWICRKSMFPEWMSEGDIRVSKEGDKRVYWLDSMPLFLNSSLDSYPLFPFISLKHWSFSISSSRCQFTFLLDELITACASPMRDPENVWSINRGPIPPFFRLQAQSPAQFQTLLSYILSYASFIML